MLQDFLLVPSKEHFSSIMDGILETFASNYIHHSLEPFSSNLLLSIEFFSYTH